VKSVEIKPGTLSLDIQSLPQSIYGETIEGFINCFSRHLGVLWIGQFGFISTPGISDIDLLLVCKDEDCKEIKFLSNEFITQSPLHQYLFIHDVFVIPQSGMKGLFFFHPLDNLRTLWGDPEILNECERVDEMIRLFRAVHWASSNWSKTLQLCGQDSVGLRSILVRSKSLVTAAYHNYFLMGHTTSLSSITKQIDAERDQILNANPDEKSHLARAAFRNAIQTLAKSDWELNDWMIQKGLSNGFYERKKIWLSERHFLLFDNHRDFDPANFHQHSLGTHITHLPSFYYAIGFLVSQPYFQLEPSLSRLWDAKAATHFENVEMRLATDKWGVAFWENVNSFRTVGLQPLALDVYPFNVQRVDPIMIKLLKQVLPSNVRHWFRAQVSSLTGRH
jgi:hypothetical protein